MPDLRRGVAAFPRIARPATTTARRINAALTRLDGRLRRAVAGCLRAAPTGTGSWERTVDITMTGPGFVSVLVTDDVFCGGAYPSQSHAALVYDLTTGAPVDWATLLPARLTGIRTLQEGPDGMKTVALASPRLRALYAAGHDAAIDAQGSPAACRGLPEDNDAALPMQAWLDGRRGGLMLQFDLNHAMQACSAPVLVPAESLRREGAGPRLVNALLAARAGARQRFGGPAR